ncbi:MAG: GatB/YqeY domain-containing protein [Acidobacteriota bacterium]
MTTPQETVQNDIKAAMKARDKERLSTLRMLLAALKNEKIAQGEEVGDDAFLGVVKRLVKQRKDSASQFEQAGRQELADKENAEIEVLSSYLPAQADEATVRQAIEELVATEGLEGPKAIGRVMKAMMSRFGASADGGTINRIARDLLNPKSSG